MTTENIKFSSQITEAQRARVRRALSASSQASNAKLLEAVANKTRELSALLTGLPQHLATGGYASANGDSGSVLYELRDDAGQKRIEDSAFDLSLLANAFAHEADALTSVANELFEAEKEERELEREEKEAAEYAAWMLTQDEKAAEDEVAAKEESSDPSPSIH